MKENLTEKRVTSFDVARHAGVSRSVVSRAFTKGAIISDTARAKVLQSADELGYQVNYLARGLQTKHSNLVGIVASALDTPYRARQVRIAAQECIKRGFRPILLTAESAVESEKLTSLLFNYNVAGVIITSAEPSSKIITECNRLSIPIVMVNRGSDISGADCVQMDIDQAGALAYQMLNEAGAHRLAVLMPRVESYSVSGRARAFVDICKKHKTPALVFTSSDQSYTAGLDAAQEIGPSIDTLDGIFCATDLLALGLLDGLRHNWNIKVPENLSVVGCDDIEQASWCSYQLSTIHQDADEQAIAAVNIMLKRIEDPTMATQTYIQNLTPLHRGTTKRPIRK
ncbi:MAG: substrate-binding domain-containing protein [Devosiaceae bacterium]|nr:substrate-binding domain-containing protein [Devosiaceae bacterium]